MSPALEAEWWHHNVIQSGGNIKVTSLRSNQHVQGHWPLSFRSYHRSWPHPVWRIRYDFAINFTRCYGESHWFKFKDHDQIIIYRSKVAWILVTVYIMGDMLHCVIIGKWPRITITKEIEKILYGTIPPWPWSVFNVFTQFFFRATTTFPHRFAAYSRFDLHDPVWPCRYWPELINTVYSVDR